MPITANAACAAANDAKVTDLSQVHFKGEGFSEVLPYEDYGLTVKL